MDSHKEKRGFYVPLLFILLLALTELLPAVRSQAAVRYGAVTSAWTKAGSYSFQLKKNGTLSYKKGSGKEKVIAKKVKSARYCGAKVAYCKEYVIKEGKTERYKTPCGIYDCAAGKMVKTWQQGDMKLDGYYPAARLCGFYGDTLVFTDSWSAGIMATSSIETGKITPVAKWGNFFYAGAFQYGKYLVYLLESNKGLDYVKLNVMDLTTCRSRTISKKGYAVSLKGGKLYFAEVTVRKYTIPKQTVNIYSCTISGAGKKKLGSFSVSEEYRYDAFKGSKLSLVPGEKAVYVRMENEDGDYSYRAMKYGSGKLNRSTQAVFNSNAKKLAAHLVSEGLTEYNEDDLDLD